MSLKRAGHAQFIGNVPDGGLVLSFFEDRVILVLHHEVAHVQWHSLLNVFGQEVGEYPVDVRLYSRCNLKTFSGLDSLKHVNTSTSKINI